MLGLFFFYLSVVPGSSALVIGWLETSMFPFEIGLFFCVLGIGWFIRTLLLCKKRRVLFCKGRLSCLVEDTVFRQLVYRLWAEFFERKDLRVYLLCTKSGLTIEGETPVEWEDFDLLEEFLAKKLFSLTGYWGPIKIKLRCVSSQATS
jgi:hypothetical protein